MKQLYIYFAVLLALMLLPGGMDAAKLAPAQLVYLSADDGGIAIRTDLGNSGYGQDLEEAFADLEDTTAGKIFLDTADYLVVTPAAENLLPELHRWLKGSCRICSAEKVEDLERAATYLEAHEPQVKLRDWEQEREPLEVLTEREGRYNLVSEK